MKHIKKFNENKDFEKFDKQLQDNANYETDPITLEDIKERIIDELKFMEENGEGLELGEKETIKIDYESEDLKQNIESLSKRIMMDLKERLKYELFDDYDFDIWDIIKGDYK